MPISDHSRKDKEILFTAEQKTALDKRRQRPPETGFPVDFHWTKVTIPSCETGLSLNFVVWVHICHNITVRRSCEADGFWTGFPGFTGLVDCLRIILLILFILS